MLNIEKKRIKWQVHQRRYRSTNAASHCELAECLFVFYSSKRKKDSVAGGVMQPMSVSVNEKNKSGSTLTLLEILLALQLYNLNQQP